MELKRTANPKRIVISLENATEARLFASEGLGLLSIKGVQLALDVIRAQGEDQWPVETAISSGRLKHVANRMSDEAARLKVVGALPGFSEYPNAVENEEVLRGMVSTIREHQEITVPELALS